MITVSLCMIVKNEEENLGKCLKSLQGIVDEMIVVDTGSEDRTVDIAKEFGAKVYDFKWTGDFSEARNYSFSLATCDYIYSADADEELDEDNRQRFIRLKKDIEELDIDIVQMYYCNQLSFGRSTIMTGNFARSSLRECGISGGRIQSTSRWSSIPLSVTARLR